MTRSRSESLVVVNDALPEHIGQMAVLLTDNLDDMWRGAYEYTDLAQVARYGNEALQLELAYRIERSRVQPDDVFLQVALDGERVAGFAAAEGRGAARFGGLTRWDGLLVADDYARTDTAIQLESARRRWAVTIGRPVMALVISGESHAGMDRLKDADFTRRGVMSDSGLNHNYMLLTSADLLSKPASGTARVD
jgi:hypothetical protein